MQKIVNFPPGASEQKPRREKGDWNGQELRMLTASQAARATGVSYGHMLEVFRVHGVRIGRIYYMSIVKLASLLGGAETW